MHFLYRTYPPHPAALRRCRQLNFHVTSATHKCLSITIFFSGQVLGPAVLEFRISQLRAAKHCRSCSLSEADAGCAALSSSSPSLSLLLIRCQLFSIILPFFHQCSHHLMVFRPGCFGSQTPAVKMVTGHDILIHFSTNQLYHCCIHVCYQRYIANYCLHNLQKSAAFR